MAVYLNDVEGNPISLMGSGSTQWSQGTGVNSASFGGTTLFGKHLASSGQAETTPGNITQAVAGSTSRLRYQDPLKSRPTASGGGMNASAPGAAPRQLNAPEGLKPDSTPTSMGVKALAKKEGGGKAAGTAAQVPPDEGAAGRALARGAANIGLGAYQAIKNASSAGRNAEFATGQAEAAPGGMFGATGAAGNLDEDVT